MINLFEKTNPKYSKNWLENELKLTTNINFNFFYGHHPTVPGILDNCCFSQWWPSKFNFNNYNFNCMEQFMMACKAELFKDYFTRDKILKNNNPKEIKYVSMVNSSLNDFLAKLNALTEIVKVLIKTEIE